MNSLLDNIPYYLKGIFGITAYHLKVGWISEEGFKKRITICSQCDFIRNYNKELKHTRCGSCGCSIIKKLTLKRSRCPKGKWNKEV